MVRIIKILIITSLLFLTACTSTERLEVQTKTIMSPPIILDKPVRPTPTKNPLITITPEVAQTYSEACSDFKAGTVLKDEYIGLDEHTACNYAIQGFTSTGWSNEKQDKLLLNFYIKQLENQRDLYERQLTERYQQGKQDE